MREQGLEPFGISQRRQRRISDFAEQVPEAILAVRIILRLQERGGARQAAQDQQTNLCIDDGRETAFAVFSGRHAGISVIGK